jgi:hypothetical protein
MKPIEKFIGINNIAAPERHEPGELQAALDVDIDSTGALVSRRGRAPLTGGDGEASCVWQAPNGLLMLLDGYVQSLPLAGGSPVKLSPNLGCDDRVWFVKQPDGRIAWSNGLINGLIAADLQSAAPWGIAPPTIAGDAAAGETPYWLTWVRLSDGLQSAPMYCGPTTIGQPHTGLEVRAGFATAVWYAVDGLTGFYAGLTTTDEFTFTDPTDRLVTPCHTEHRLPPPPGICLSDWSARTLMAVGNVLIATTAYQREQYDPRRDFIQFPDPITWLFGVDDGIWVGTTTQLMFMRGETLDTLKNDNVVPAPVVLGSGTPTTDLSLLPADARPDGALIGAFCVCGNEIMVCGNSGHAQPLAPGRYKVPTMTSCWATTRVRDGVLQYLVSPA